MPGGNTANGAGALFSNNGGTSNTAVGIEALVNNTDGSGNTAVGASALSSETSAFSNVAIGQEALSSNTTGLGNIAIGTDAGSNLTTGSSNIDIYDFGVAGDDRTIRIGNQGTQNKTFIAGISGETSASGVEVFINTSGQLGTTTSSKRFKEDIKPMDKTSEAILALKPVTFRYKKELDPQGIP